jgi:hypothetical protein
MWAMAALKSRVTEAAKSMPIRSRQCAVAWKEGTGGEGGREGGEEGGLNDAILRG